MCVVSSNLGFTHLHNGTYRENTKYVSPYGRRRSSKGFGSKLTDADIVPVAPESVETVVGLYIEGSLLLPG